MSILSLDDVKVRILRKCQGVQGQEPTLCWVWAGAIRSQAGYGTMWWNKRRWLVHRLAWTAWKGPLAPGLELDHLCANRKCCNPDHLEPVTHQINIARGRSWNAEKTHCPKGHEYDFWRHYAGGKLKRGCKRCWAGYKLQKRGRGA